MPTRISAGVVDHPCKVDVLLDHGVSLLFVLHLAFLTCYATFQAKNSVKNAPASTALS